MRPIFKNILLGLFVVAISQTAFSQRNKQHTKVVVVQKSMPRKSVVYTTPKKKVLTVRTLPKTTVIINNKGTNYYYDQNTYYRFNGGRYMPVAPTLGLRINVLPIGYRSIVFNNHTYFSHRGIYYIANNNEYEVVAPEIGTTVYELPEDAEKVTIDGQELYEFNDVLYEKIQKDGTRAYEVIGYVND